MQAQKQTELSWEQIPPSYRSLWLWPDADQVEIAQRMGLTPATQTKASLPHDPLEFARRAGFPDPYPWQEKLLRWTGKNLLLNVTRQGGKSSGVGIYCMNHAYTRQDALVSIFSPTDRQSGELFIKIKKWMHYLEIETKKENESEIVLPNGSRILSLPGTEATVRSLSGVTLRVLDEASRIKDDLYFATNPMVAVSGGQTIMASTPFTKRGVFYQEWTTGINWDRIEVPATEIPTFAPEFLESELHAMGEWWFKQEYMCQFMDPIANVFSDAIIQDAVSGQVTPLFPNVGFDRIDPGDMSDQDVRPLFTP